MGAETHRYGLFGLRLRSTRPLPGLRPRRDVEGADDLSVSFDPAPGAGPWDEAGEILRRTQVVTTRRIQGDAWTRLDFDAGGSFLVDRTGSTVRILDDGAVPPEDLFRFLLGSVTGFALRRRGLTCLHGAVLARGARAFALVGPSGSGKSTLSAALLDQGCTLVSDDVLALREEEGAFQALPGTARVRLWQDAADHLLGARARHVPLGHSRPKRLWDLSGDETRLRDTPCALAAVYRLHPRSDLAGPPRFEIPAGSELLVTLLANTYPNPEHYPLDAAVRAREFEVLGRLVERLPLRDVAYARDLASLDATCRALVADLDALLGLAP